jgi:penicillin-binding protein 1A
VQETVQRTLSEWDGYPKLADERQNKVTEVISDSITIETVEPQAASVVIDQHTGEIRAIVGGRTEPQIRKGLNRATQSYVEIGSSIKPLAVYGPALDNGASPATVVANVTGEIDGWGGEKGYPEGGLLKKHFGPVTVRYGLTHSLNVVAARLLFSRYVGVDRAVEYLKRLGISESQLNKDGPGLALGTSGISPMQLCAAYAAIANNGYYNEPLSFTRVVDKDGKEILNADILRGSPTKVYSDSSTPYMLVDLLKNAVASGTGTKAQIPGYEVAGKTGTNSDYASVCFAGMTCKYTAVVWIGHDQPANKLAKESSGGDYAAVLWNLFMTQLMDGAESEPIIDETETSLGLIQRTVCPISGKLATDACIHYRNSRDEFKKYKTVTDWFTYSNVPTEPCDMHVTLSICKQSGLIAGKYCDTNDIEQITFVLLRPGNQFYHLDDSVLDRLFSDSWVRTDRTVSQFILEYPVCTIDSSFDSLKQKGESLILSVETLLAESASVTEADIAKVNAIIESMRRADNSVDYHAAYDQLLSEYNRLILLP